MLRAKAPNYDAYPISGTENIRIQGTGKVPERSRSMQPNEIRASQITVEVTDETTGETYRRTLPVDYCETANFLRLRGEDMNGKPSELVFLSDTGMRRLKDLMGKGPDEDPCGTHS